MREIWKDIPGYEGYYQVSNLGRVKSLKRKTGNKRNNEDIILKTYLRASYLFVRLRKDNKYKNYLVHRLVASAFIPNPDNLPQVNHIDENKINNIVNNLEWCDAKYNNNYGTKRERVRVQKTNTSVDMLSTDGTFIKNFYSIAEATRQTKISSPHICQCCKGYRETAGGFKWAYAS